MIKTLVIIAVVCAAALLGPLLADSQGFVHIATGSYIVECSLTTAAVILVVTFAVLYVLIVTLARVLHIPTWIRRWLRRHGEDKSRSLQDRAYLAYEEGDYAETIALINRTEKMSEMPPRSLLIGAKSAFELQRYELASAFLDEAERRGDDAAAAAAIIRARLNLRIGNAKVALENLDKVKSNYSNRLVSKMYYDARLQEEDLDGLFEASARLVKDGVITGEEAHDLMARWFESSLRAATLPDQMFRIWKRIGKEDRANPAFCAPYVCKLVQMGDLSRARSATLDILGSSPDPVFIESISTWPHAIPEVLARLREMAEGNSASAEGNLPLLKALGNLELKSDMLNEALGHYQKALTLGATPDIYFKLGEIYSRQQKFPEAAERFAKGYGLLESSRALAVEAQHQ
ncbi:MAG: hypothetical protein K6A65_04920 [Succinivibrionaceae bacterium]|nr:hypothetical protein [Succinivibrionaceae bacterium]